MKPPGTILAATDLSAPAGYAGERAFRLAASGGSELHLVHALELDTLDSLREMLGDDLSAVKARLEDNARDQLKRLVINSTSSQGVALQLRVAPGNPLSVIAAEAEALDADLVVLGARGESFLRNAVLGATAARLLRKSVRRPILMVKQPPHAAFLTMAFRLAMRCMPSTNGRRHTMSGERRGLWRRRKYRGVRRHALVGIIDPPRTEAREAIATCRAAGIQVKMITGDHRVTTAAIARELGLQGEAHEGRELDGLTQVEIAALVEKSTVFARVAPEHKMRIVEALQAKGHVVAMTGDGVNASR